MFERLFDDEVAKIHPATVYVTDRETGESRPTDYAYFGYGEAIYVAKKLPGEKLPADPAKWSVIVNGSGILSINPDYPFYYSNSNLPYGNAPRMAELYSKLGGTPLPSEATIVPSFENAEAPDAIRNILVSKLQRSPSAAAPGTPGLAVKNNPVMLEDINALETLFSDESLKSNANFFGSENCLHAQMTAEGGPGIRRQKALLAAASGISLEIPNDAHGFTTKGSSLYLLSGQTPQKSMLTVKDELKDGKREAQVGLTPAEPLAIHESVEDLDKLIRSGEGVKYFVHSAEEMETRVADIQQFIEREKPADNDKNTDPAFGSELAGRDIETWKWYRIFREEDYTQRSDSGLFHDAAKSDYFMMTELDGKRQLLFIPGDGRPMPESFKPVESTELVIPGSVTQPRVYGVDAGEGHSLAYPSLGSVKALEKIGVNMDTPLIHISRYELGQLKTAGKLEGLNLTYVEGWGKARGEYRPREKIMDDVLYISPVPLSQPISGTSGVINGDVDHLHVNSLYRISDERYFVLFDFGQGIDHTSKDRSLFVKPVVLRKEGDQFVAERLQGSDLFTQYAPAVVELLGEGAALDNVSGQEARGVISRIDPSSAAEAFKWEQWQETLMSRSTKAPIGETMVENLRKSSKIARDRVTREQERAARQAGTAAPGPAVETDRAQETPGPASAESTAQSADAATAGATSSTSPGSSRSTSSSERGIKDNLKDNKGLAIAGGLLLGGAAAIGVAASSGKETPAQAGSPQTQDESTRPSNRKFKWGVVSLCTLVGGALLVYASRGAKGASQSWGDWVKSGGTGGHAR